MDILSIGELLVDLVATRGDSLASTQAVTFRRAAGGAPANVAAGAARLLGSSGRVGFVGCVGDDSFGRFLRATLESFGVDTSYLSVSRDMQTPVAVVGRGESGDIEFSFYGPDDGRRLALFGPDDLPRRALEESRIVVMGGVSLAHPVSSNAATQAARCASAGQALLALDPNWRPVLWADVRDWVGAVRHLLPSVDIIKVSSGELDILTGTSDLDEGTALLAGMAAFEAGDRPFLAAVTRGGEGSGYVLYSQRVSPKVAHSGTVSGVRVNAIDPTGAGDAFLAGLLTGLLGELGSRGGEGAVLDLAALQPAAMHEILRFANATAALTTTQRGAMSGLPSRRAVQRVLEGRRWT